MLRRLGATDLKRLAGILKRHKIVLRKQLETVRQDRARSTDELRRIKLEISECYARLDEIEASLDLLTDEIEDATSCADVETAQDEYEDLLAEREDEVQLILELQEAHDLEVVAAHKLSRLQQHVQQEATRLHRIEQALAANALRLGIVKLGTATKSAKKQV